MSFTDIYKSSSLLQYARCTHYEAQAIIQPTGRQVYIVTNLVDQNELDRFHVVMNVRSLNVRVSIDFDDEFTLDENGGALPYPKICITSGLAIPPGRNRPDECELPAITFIGSLTYFLVIEGLNASRQMKLIMKNDLQHAADEMLHEALNGHSTVFSGAILRRNFAKLTSIGETTWIFKRANDMEDAMNIEEEDISGETIGVIC